MRKTRKRTIARREFVAAVAGAAACLGFGRGKVLGQSQKGGGLVSTVQNSNLQTRDVQHRFVETNGIRMHIAEQGSGPLVVLCHGFPESWYSWRHQLPAIAEAGFRAVAPDMRGYGQTDRPVRSTSTPSFIWSVIW